MARKLSPAQRRMLDNIARGESPTAHCRTMSDHGGADGTLRSLVRRKLLTSDYKLTVAGEEAITLKFTGLPEPHKRAPRGQADAVRTMRIARGQCPQHGVALVQVTAASVQCPRRDCTFTTHRTTK